MAITTINHASSAATNVFDHTHCSACGVADRRTFKRNATALCKICHDLFMLEIARQQGRKCSQCHTDRTSRWFKQPSAPFETQKYLCSECQGVKKKIAKKILSPSFPLNNFAVPQLQIDKDFKTKIEEAISWKRGLFT